MMLQTKYQSSRLYGFRQEYLFMFLPLKAYVKHMTPERSHLWPQGYTLNKLDRGLLNDTKIPKKQGSRSCGFRQNLFMFVPIQAYVKHMTPGVQPFLAPGL